MERRLERLTGSSRDPSALPPFPPPPVSPVPPAEPADLKATWLAAATDDPGGTRRRLADATALSGSDALPGWLWAHWGSELRTGGTDEKSLKDAVVALDRETWLWVLGEREWEELAGLVYGRAVRLARQRSGATSTNG